MVVWVARFLVVAFAGFAGAAHASNVVPSGAVAVEGGETGFRFVDGAGKTVQFNGRTWTDASAAGVRAIEDYGVKVGGASVAVRAARLLPMGPLAAAAAAAYTGWEIGSAIADAAGLTPGKSPDAGVLPSPAGPVRDPGTEPESATLWTCDGVKGVSAGQACTSRGAQLAADEMRSFPDHRVTIDGFACSGPLWTGAYSCVGTKRTSTYNTAGDLIGTGTAPFELPAYPTSEKGAKCKGYIDALNPAFSVPEDHSPTRSDGKCGSGRYSPTSLAKMVEQLEKGLKARPDKAKEVAKDIVENKGQEIPGASEREMSGPASATGTPTEKKETSPTGDITITTNTPTYNFNYAGPNMTWTTTNITTVKKGDAPPVKVSEETKPPEDTKSDCDKHPNTIGCSEYGTPSGGDVVRTTKTVTFEPGAYPDSGSCPAPRTFDLRGHTYSVAWTPICDAASTYVRPIVLVLASALGAFIFIGGLKA